MHRRFLLFLGHFNHSKWNLFYVEELISTSSEKGLQIEIVAVSIL